MSSRETEQKARGVQPILGPPARRRRADAERSIATIVDAALTCFDEDPDASMSAIARAAGVGRVTLYSHFPSREVLLEAVLARTVPEAATVLDSEMLEEGPPAEALSRLIRAAWRILDRHRRLAAAAAHHLTPSGLRAGHDLVLDRIERLIARGQAEGAFRTDLPLTWLVTAIYSLTHAAAQEVDAARLASADAPSVLERTLLAALEHRAAGERPCR